MDFVDIAYIVTIAGGATLGAIIATVTLSLLIFRKKHTGKKIRSWVMILIVLFALEGYIIAGVLIFYESEANLRVSARIDDRFLIIVLIGVIIGLIISVTTFVLAKFKVLSTSYEKQSRFRSLTQIDRHMQD
jgi:hypothetical protein